MSTVPARFEIEVTVGPEDIDELGHVNNVVYLQWVQDAAAAHWRSVATPDQLGRVLWVAVRHEIEYKAPAFAGERLTARTWVPVWTAVTSERHTEIRRVDDEVLLVSAKTVWCAVDAESRKPTRVGEAVKERFLA